jgi:hypothetical protein
MYRHILCIVGLLLAVACRHDSARPAVPVIDLLHELDRAEKRPPDGFELTAHEEHDVVRAAVVAPVPSRLTIPLRLPKRGALRASVTLQSPDPSAAVRFRVGISDDRIYEGLDALVLKSDRRGWVDLRTDLSAYAGFKWSLFYRPDRTTWRLVLAADAVAGVPGRAVWGRPEIVADEASAKEYVAARNRR